MTTQESAGRADPPLSVGGLGLGSSPSLAPLPRRPADRRPPRERRRADPSRHDAADTPPPRRIDWARAALWMRNLGLLVLLFCAYQIWGTGLTQANTQARLKDSFRQAAPAPAGSAADAPQLTAPEPDGEAIAIMRIPKIGLDQAVVEGTSAGDLRKGPGHYADTPLPGEGGNAAIAGHRTTYGAPFRNLDDLRVGDEILVTTPRGSFRYAVSEPVKVVAPGEDAVIGDFGDARLTLTTCHPVYQASDRLIVVAIPLDPLPPAQSVRPASSPDRPAAQASGQLALDGESAAWVPIAFWGLAFLLTVLGFRPVQRAFPVLAYVLVVPVVAVTLFELFGHISRLLPAGF